MDKRTRQYRRAEFKALGERGGVYKPSFKIHTIHGATKHIGITWAELAAIEAILTK